MKIAILYLMSLFAISSAQAAFVTLEYNGQVLTQFSLVSPKKFDADGYRIEEYRVTFDGTESVYLETPGTRTTTTAKLVDDRRQMDGCLEIQLTNDIQLKECMRDAPTEWELHIQSQDKTIKLLLNLPSSHLRIRAPSK